ncbi:xylose isomerase [Gammaproteobacteria bacterium AS21]
MQNNVCQFEGVNSESPLAFRHYDKNKQVLGKSLAEQLRFSACYWHNFCWAGADVFGAGTFDRPWIDGSADALTLATQKMDYAFGFFRRLDVPYFSFHDRDIAPEGRSAKESLYNLEYMIDLAGKKMDESGLKLLWGTANLFSHPRYAAGAATNPDPDVFKFAAHQVKNAMDATLKLGGENYVLWGGREGYETLLNTNLRRELDQLGRFLTMVVDYKHKIGFTGDLLIEPKPQEPTKHQYDYDTATVYGFLKHHGLENEFKVNIEVNHATLAGHSFHHEVATSAAFGLMGSFDANRGDPQNGWDTDQFPNSVEEMTLACYEIIRAGGLQKGGFNFDTKLRRQSMHSDDMLLGHVGAMDVVAKSFMNAAKMHEDAKLQAFVDDRYGKWQGVQAQQIMSGAIDLSTLSSEVEAGGINPTPVSGRQEMLENLVNRYIF